jgi:hypothetical protein
MTHTKKMGEDDRRIAKVTQSKTLTNIKMVEDNRRIAKVTQSKTLTNIKMCKDEWNGLNSNYKNGSNCHLKTNHHNPFYDLIIEEHHKHHLPRQFNTKFYGAIEALQEKININRVLHVEDVRVEIDGMYVP